MDYLKEKVDRDYLTFHWWPAHYHYFTYFFEATEESLLYFTYNNTTIFRAEYENYEEIFNIESSDNYCYWEGKLCGSWYINYTQVPYALNSSSTVGLNDVILVKMTLDYNYLFGNVGGVWYKIEQFVVLDSNLQFIFIPLVVVMVA